jgi:hypothetical protein
MDGELIFGERNEISDHVQLVIDLLVQDGRTRLAEWLTARRAVLEDHSAPTTRVLAELHGVSLGILHGAAPSAELAKLAEQLHRSTYPWEE